MKLLPLTLLLFLPARASAQGRELEFHVGRWWVDGGATSYELRATYPLGRVFTHGLSGILLLHDTLGRNQAFYGMAYELQAFRRRRAIGAYALSGIALGLSTDPANQELGALWSVGAGVEWRPVPWLALGAEARYRIEDRGPRGFWHLRSDARTGLGWAIGGGLGFGRRGPRPGRARPAPAEAPTVITGAAADVVRTALAALGSPYEWGGTAENGFDCSGLIQYAYGRYGVRLPRMSRDQARAGSAVPPTPEALQPGDILLFSATPGGGVTHVGMYVGERKFIHSSSTGVRLSRLDRQDPEAIWWLPRWVGARRVLGPP